MMDCWFHDSIHLCHGCDDLRKLLFRHILKIDPANFCRESRMKLLDRDGLERRFLNDARHVCYERFPPLCGEVADFRSSAPVDLDF